LKYSITKETGQANNQQKMSIKHGERETKAKEIPRDFRDPIFGNRIRTKQHLLYWSRLAEMFKISEWYADRKRRDGNERSITVLGD